MKLANEALDTVSRQEVALTIKRNWDGVLQFHATRMTEGFLEGINSLVLAA